MDSIDRPPPGIVDPQLRQLFDYWTTIRGERRMPSRAEVDPSDMRFILGHVMIVDVTQPPAGFRIRLQGTELAWCLGSDLTGRPLDVLEPPDLRALIREGFAQCVATHAPLFRAARQLVGGMPRLYSLLVLPLSTDASVVDKLLVAIRCKEAA